MSKFNVGDRVVVARPPMKGCQSAQVGVEGNLTGSWKYIDHIPMWKVKFDTISEYYSVNEACLELAHATPDDGDDWI